MRQLSLPPDPAYRPPVTVAYGMGVDSTAMLIGLHQRGVRPDIILFADTGAEKPETYAFETPMQEWLRSVGFPPIITVRYVPRNFKNWPQYYTLEDNCLTNGTLPGISFGPASCSQKWKQQPQHRHLQQWRPAVECWGRGDRVVKLIGFDASPADRRRTFAAGPDEGRHYVHHYPLQQWGWDRENCKRHISAAGLPVPPKSSCFFCLAMKPAEVEALQPEYLRRIVAMEARAKPRLTASEGLWRTTVKGTRGGTPRPGSMTAFIRANGLLPTDEIDAIQIGTSRDIVAFQTGFAQATREGRITEFLDSEPRDYRHFAPTIPIDS